MLGLPCFSSSIFCLTLDTLHGDDGSDLSTSDRNLVSFGPVTSVFRPTGLVCVPAQLNYAVVRILCRYVTL